MIATDLSKHQKRNADPKAIQQINFTGNHVHIIWRLFDGSVSFCFVTVK